MAVPRATAWLVVRDITGDRGAGVVDGAGQARGVSPLVSSTGSMVTPSSGTRIEMASAFMLSQRDGPLVGGDS